MDQFLISRTSDSLNKRSVVETGRGARYLQDCLFLLIRKSSPGLEPPPRLPSPRLPQNKSLGLSAASCQVFDPSTDWVGKSMLLLRARWSFDLTILLSMENIYLPLAKYYTENLTFWGYFIHLFPSILCGAPFSEGHQDEFVAAGRAGNELWWDEEISRSNSCLWAKFLRE